MTTPLGEEFIRIRPDLSGFRAELNAQMQGALRGAAAQAAAAQAPLASAVKGTTASGIILPTTVRSVKDLGTNTAAVDAKMKALDETQKRVRASTDELGRATRRTEQSLGRTARGLVAATAASTGFFRAVSFASGAFLVGAVAGATIGAAVQEFTEMTRVGAQTAAVIKATGGAANVTAQQMDQLALAQLRLTGTDDELIKQGGNVLLTFRAIRNETGEGNQVFTRALKAAQDISTVFRTDLRGSAVQLGKALQDPVRGVTALRRSGISLSQGQRDLIKSMVESGRIMAAQKLILSEVERQVGGTAEAYGRTLPGRLAIMREESINSLGAFVQKISESEDATKAFTDTTAGLGSAFDVAFGALATSIGAVADITQALRLDDLASAVVPLRDLVQALALLTTSYLALRGALAAATFAQRTYTKATTVATAATAAEGAAATATAARISIWRAGLVALRGPLGIALAITAGTVAITKMREAAQRAPGSLGGFRNALDDLNDALERNANLRDRLAGQRENVSIGRADVLAAERAVAAARAAQATGGGDPNSLQQLALRNRVIRAENELAEATRKLRARERERDITLGQLTANERGRAAVIRQTTSTILDQVNAIGNAKIPTSLPILRGAARLIGGEADSFDEILKGLAESTKPLERSVGRTLRGIADVLGDIDKLSDQQITIAVRILGQGGTTNDVFNQLFGTGRPGQPRVLEAGTEAIRVRGLANARTESQIIEDQFLAQRAIVRALQQKEVQARKNLRVQREETAAAREAVAAAREARREAIRALADARQSLADSITALREAIVGGAEAIAEAVRAARDATNQAIEDAKTNLDSLGQSLGDMLNRAREALGERTTKITPGIAALRERVRRGEGGPETQRAAQQIAFQLQGRDKAAATDATKALEKLTDDLNVGLIKNMPQFNKQLAAATKGIDLGQLRKLDPVLARQITRYIEALRKQAAEILTSGKPGAVQPPFVNIAQTIREGARSIADARKDAARDIRQATRNVASAQRDVADAVRTVGETERDLARAVNRLRREQTRETKLNTVALNRHRRVLEAQNKLLRGPNRPGGNQPKRKPQGRESQQGSELVIGGAQSP